MRRSLLAGDGRAVFGGRFIGTPNAGVALAEDGVRELRASWRLIRTAGNDAMLQSGVEAVRRESAIGEAGLGVSVGGAVRF